MNQYSLPILVIASISFYVGIYHLMMYFRDRKFRYNLTFAFLCFTTTLYDIFCIGLYHVTSVSAGIYWIRIQMISLAFLVAFLLLFISDFTNYERKRIVNAIIALFLLVAAIQIIDRSHLTWIIDQPSIKTILLPGGNTITYYEVAL